MPKSEQEITFKSLFVPFTTKKAVIFIAIIGLIVFFNGLFNNFVRDDISQIVENSSIKSIWNIPTFFFENRLETGAKTLLGGSYFKPMLDSSFAITYAVFGENQFPFHLFQIIFYITNACLLFILFKHFFRKEISFILSVIFLVHPITNEVALYISDTQEVLFLFFGILSLLFLTLFKSKKSVVIASLLLFISLLSKETGILFYCVSFLYVCLFARKKLLLLSMSSVISISIYAFLRFHALGNVTQALSNFPFGRLNLITRILNIPEIILFYLKTVFLPFNASASYNWFYTRIDFPHFFLPLIIDLAFFAFIISFAVILYKKFSRKVFTIYLFFMIWFFLGLVFHLQLIPLDQTVAGRWFYFPLVGLLGMFGIIMETANFNLKSKWLIIVIIIFIASFSIKTFTESFNFKDDLTLTNHDFELSKNSLNSDYNLEYLISYMYYQNNQLKEAKIHAEKSVQYFPTITNYTNLGAIESSLGNYKDAKNAYEKALQYGNDSLPYDNLASLSLAYGNPVRNISFIKNVALRKFSTDGILWFNLAILQYKQGNVLDAKKDIEKARKYYPTNPNLDLIDYIIINNKQLNMTVKNGNLNFYTF